ncbi:MAG: hypothetical protein JKY60_06460 [Kordiimonadaceae bacterium]|nr:hypothetical protein [Kordiimonadaceae bacterium]
MKSKTVTLILYILGGYHFATGIMIYFLTDFFYENFTSHTGPLNSHFLADVGAAYITAGAALLMGAYIAKWRVPFAVSALMFLGLHSLIHITEMVTGKLSSEQAVSDVVTVILPSAFVGLMIYLTLKMAKKEESAG